MAVVSGTVHSVQTVKSDAVSGLQIAEVLFTVSGTYAQADNGQLLTVPTLIANSRRNGKTATLVAAMPSTPATYGTGSGYMALKTVAVSSTTITFEITLDSYTAEYTDATSVQTQIRPFALLVAFTEA